MRGAGVGNALRMYGFCGAAAACSARVCARRPRNRGHRRRARRGGSGKGEREDGGASSRSGVLESTINLEIAKRIEDLLHFAGVRTQMIRTQDVSVYTEGGSIQQKKVSDLKNRVQMVERTPNALLLSIHQNYFPEAKYHGAQVFYAKTPGSEALAALLQQTLRTCVDPENHRREKPAEAVYLMEKVSCTAVLVECGFLSNEPEAEKLTQAQYQKQLTGAVCGALCSYLETEGESQ